MRRFITGLAATALVIGAPGALTSTASAADTARTGAPPVQAAATPAPAFTQNNATARSPRAEPVASTPPSTKMICLSVSLQCFKVVAAASGSSPTRPLDLRAPDIRNLVSEAELQQRVEDDWAIREREEEQQVRVEAARPDVYVPGGLASLPWAVRNPTQAWRIFLPVPSAK